MRDMEKIKFFPMSVRLTGPVLDKLRARAQRERRTVAALGALLIEDALAQEESTDAPAVSDIDRYRIYRELP